MKKTTSMLCGIAVLLLTSFRPNLNCDYARSNVGYATSKIKEALRTDHIDQARFYSYKALNALEKSKNYLKACGCTMAKKSMSEGSELLVLATQSNTLEGTKNYLIHSMELTGRTMAMIQNHESHEGNYSDDALAMNANYGPNSKGSVKKAKSLSLTARIDRSLEKYRVSLDKVVTSVDCRQAKEFANRIYRECETQLLKPGLSDGKKYFNLRTKEITLNALRRIGTCSEKKP